MKISIDELRSAPQQRMSVSFKQDVKGLDTVKPVIGDLQLLADSSGARVAGQVQTLLKLNCDRCLRPYFQQLSVPIDERFIENIDTEGVPRDRELLRGDFVEPLPRNGMLDISDIVNQAVTLATPTFCLCGDECPGPPVTNRAGDEGSTEGGGSRTAVDPRWKNLKTLFPKDETEENS